MGKRERYAPGTFCWVDLATTDAEGAKAFYGELFGWEAEDMPARACYELGRKPHFYAVFSGWPCPKRSPFSAFLSRF